MNRPYHPSPGALHIQVVPEILSDRSVAWNVHYELPDGTRIVFDCEHQAHANALADQLRACTNVDITETPS